LLVDLKSLYYFWNFVLRRFIFLLVRESIKIDLPIYGDSMGRKDLGTVDLELKADDLRMFKLIFSF